MRPKDELLAKVCASMMHMEYFRSIDLNVVPNGVSRYDLLQRGVSCKVVDYDRQRHVYKVREGWRTTLEKLQKHHPEYLPKKAIADGELTKSQIAALAFTTVQHAMKHRHPLELVWG